MEQPGSQAGKCATDLEEAIAANEGPPLGRERTHVDPAGTSREGSPIDIARSNHGA